MKQHNYIKPLPFGLLLGVIPLTTTSAYAVVTSGLGSKCIKKCKKLLTIPYMDDYKPKTNL